jgi:hypothetical protein
MQKSSAPGRQIIRFYGVIGIKITTQDTITIGAFTKLEFNRAGDKAVCRLVLKDLDAKLNDVQFTFSWCELRLGERRNSRGPRVRR